MVALYFVSTCLLLFSEAGAFTAPSSRVIRTDGSSTLLFLSKPNNSDDWMSSTQDQPWSNVGNNGGNRNQQLEERRPNMPPPTGRGGGERGRPRQPPKPGPGIGRKEYVGRMPVKPQQQQQQQQQQERRPNIPPTTAGGRQQQQQEKRPNIPQPPPRAGGQPRQQEGRRPNIPTSTPTGRGKQVTYERADVQKWKAEKLRSNNQEMEDFISGAKYKKEGSQSVNAATGLGRKPVSSSGGSDSPSAPAADDGGRFVRYNRQRDGDMLVGSEGEKLVNRAQRQPTTTNSAGNQMNNFEGTAPPGMNRPANGNGNAGSSYVDSRTGTQYQRYDKSQKDLYMDSSTDEFIQRVNPPRGQQQEDPSLAGQQLSSGFTGFSGRDFSQGNENPVQFEGRAETFQPPADIRDETNQYQQQAYYGQNSRDTGKPREPESPSIFDSIFELLENQLRQLESKDPKSDLRASREENARLMSKIDDLKQRTTWKRQEIERLKAQVRDEQADEDSDNGARDNLRISREENSMLKKELESLKARAAWKRKQIENLKAKLTDERQDGIPSRFDVANMPEDDYGNANDPVLNRSNQENKKLKMEIEEMKARTAWKRNEIERLKEKVANENRYNANNPQFSFESIDEVRKDLKLSREENDMLKKEAEHLAARAAWKRKEIERLKAQIARSSGPARTRDLLRLQYLGASMDPVEEQAPGREAEGFLTDFSGLDELDSFQRDYEVSANAPERPRPPMGRQEPPSAPESRYGGPQEGSRTSGWEAFYGTKREQESKREQLSSGRFQRSSFPRRGGDSSLNSQNAPPGAVRKPVIPRPPPQRRDPWSNQENTMNKPSQNPSRPDGGWDTYARGPNGQEFEGNMGGGWETFSDDEMPPWVEQRANAGRPNPEDAYRPSRQVQRPGSDAMFRDWPDYDVKNDSTPDGRKSPGFVGFSDTDYGEQGGNYVAPTKGG